MCVFYWNACICYLNRLRPINFSSLEMQSNHLCFRNWQALNFTTKLTMYTCIHVNISFLYYCLIANLQNNCIVWLKTRRRVRDWFLWYDFDFFFFVLFCFIIFCHLRICCTFIDAVSRRWVVGGGRWTPQYTWLDVWQ